MRNKGGDRNAQALPVRVFNFFSPCPLNRFLDSKPYPDKLVICTLPNCTVFLKKPHPLDLAMNWLQEPTLQ
jgi:hypothetical protein